MESYAVANILPGRHLSVIRDITERKQAQEDVADGKRAAPDTDGRTTSDSKNSVPRHSDAGEPPLHTMRVASY